MGKLKDYYSIPQLQKLINKNKSYSKNTGGKYNLLTERVVNYKITKSDKVLKSIIKEIKYLVEKVIKDYNIREYFNKEVADEIFEDSKTLILLKAIDSFDYSKNTAFSTHYCWKLKSFIDSKKRYYIRRWSTSSTDSLDKLLSPNEDGKDTSHNIVPTTHTRAFSKIKSELNKVYTGKGLL